MTIPAERPAVLVSVTVAVVPSVTRPATVCGRGISAIATGRKPLVAL